MKNIIILSLDVYLIGVWFSYVISLVRFFREFEHPEKFRVTEITIFAGILIINCLMSWFWLTAFVVSRKYPTFEKIANKLQILNHE